MMNSRRTVIRAAIAGTTLLFLATVAGPAMAGTLDEILKPAKSVSG